MYALSKNITQLLNYSRIHRKKIVLATGVFDVLHEEHQRFLRNAAKLGDYLLVAVETDKRVRQLKGAGRPINTLEVRMNALEGLGIASAVFPLPEMFSNPKDHEDFISLIKPDFLAVSSHTPHIDNKRRVLERYGGRLEVVLQQNPSVSSTKLIQKKWDEKAPKKSFKRRPRPVG